MGLGGKRNYRKHILLIIFLYLQQGHYKKQDDAGKVLSISFDNKHSLSEVDTIYCFLFTTKKSGAWR